MPAYVVCIDGIYSEVPVRMLLSGAHIGTSPVRQRIDHSEAIISLTKSAPSIPDFSGRTEEARP